MGSGYQAIARTIREQIVAGKYTPGEKIPSIRQLAIDFQCNKLTVHRAFEMLKQEGLIENRVGSGSYVRFPEQIAGPAAIFDFRSDYLHPSLFPYEKVQALFNQLFDTQKAFALAPTPAEGDPGLIFTLSRFYGLPAKRMMVISGAQQGLDLVAKVFRTNLSDALLFEDPTYPGAISLFKARHFVPMEDDGPNLKRLDEKINSTIRLFYTMPAVHNPTGLTYSLEKKQAISRIAEKHDLYIIEDDCFSEFQDPPARRFIDLSPERTIYIKSLSQITVSGVRLGLIVVPESLFSQFLYAKFSSDIASFGMIQRCMCELFTQGVIHEHLNSVQHKIDQRRNQLLDVIEGMDHLSAAGHQAGYSLWVKSDRRLTLEPAPWSRGEEFSFSPEARSFFRLSFMHMDDQEYRHGLTYLKRLLDETAPGK
jgi:DNA-binding transcriptional MocR family regulator